MSKARGKHGARDPYNQTKDKRRDRMSASGDCGCANCLTTAPALLSSEYRDRGPVVGNKRMQDADGRNRGHQQTLRSKNTV